MNVVIPVSPGELVDKITILEIKSARIKDKKKLKFIKKELELLKITLSVLHKEQKKHTSRLNALKKNLYNINLKLWNIENVIRSLEAKKEFGKQFVDKARSVYITNDKRSELKSKINTLFGSSTINEVKQYSEYK